MIENFNGKNNSNGFDKRPEDAKLGGRKPSIKNQLEKIAFSDGWLEFDIDDVEILIGKVRIQVPELDAIALKLWQWAMSNKGNDSLKAIEMIMNHFDGKPGGNNIQIENKVDNNPIQYVFMTKISDIPPEYRDKMLVQYQPETHEIKQPYRSEEEVREAYNIND